MVIVHIRSTVLIFTLYNNNNNNVIYTPAQTTSYFTST